jgi:hypothetical protein
MPLYNALLRTSSAALIFTLDNSSVWLPIPLATTLNLLRSNNLHLAIILSPQLFRPGIKNSGDWAPDSHRQAISARRASHFHLARQRRCLSARTQPHSHQLQRLASASRLCRANPSRRTHRQAPHRSGMLMAALCTLARRGSVRTRCIRVRSRPHYAPPRV